MNVRLFGSIAATTALLAIAAAVTAPAASAASPNYSTVTGSGCDTVTGTQWATWAPILQGGPTSPWDPAST